MRRGARILKRVSLYFAVATLGFVVGVVGLYIAWVRGGPPVEVWHTAELAAEFTTENADDVRSFEDYLQLEQSLFEQLDDTVYAHTRTGPAFDLARYSSGSSADPRGHVPDWNRSFELPADQPTGGVLLLHGMSDSPYSLRALGESLNEHGYRVVGLRMPGHGTAPSGLTSVRWEDMAAAVRLGMSHLGSVLGSKPIHIAGYSTGAALALTYVLDCLDGNAAPMPASVILISPAIGVTPAATLASWKGSLARLPGLEKLAWTPILPEFDPYKYNSFAINAGDQVHRLTRSVKGRIERRGTSAPIDDFPPTLAFLSTVDATVSADAVIDNLLEHLAVGRNELVLFDINRSSVKSTVLVSDPGPLTERLMASGTLPFHLTLITNESAESARLVSRRKAPHSADSVEEHLSHAWPRGVFSLSHVALPFPPDDPIYGKRRFASAEFLHLGQMDVQGERGLLKFPSDWLLRLRYNPFYDLLETRVIGWLDETGNRSTASSPRDDSQE